MDAEQCFREGYTYGDAATGACADSAVVAVLASNHVLNLGVLQGWWSEAEAQEAGVMAFERFDSPRACQSRCAERPMCQGFTFLLLGACARVPLRPRSFRHRRSRSSAADVHTSSTVCQWLRLNTIRCFL